MGLTGIGIATGSFAVPVSGVWALGFAPLNRAGFVNLQAMTCTSDNDISQTLIEHWNGTEWQIVPSANTSATQSNGLAGVTCLSPSDCWAGGYYNNGTVNQTLIEHWDGTGWTIVASPNADTNQKNYFNDIRCSSASDCWAVGAYNIDSTVRHQLIEHWDGMAWAIVASPNTSATEDSRAVAVACPSASDCWIVGFQSNSSNIRQTLAEHWNGTAWTIVASPNANSTQDKLHRDFARQEQYERRRLGRNLHHKLTESLGAKTRIE
jgi:hypothetical protein